VCVCASLRVYIDVYVCVHAGRQVGGENGEIKVCSSMYTCVCVGVCVSACVYRCMYMCVYAGRQVGGEDGEIKVCSSMYMGVNARRQMYMCLHG